MAKEKEITKVALRKSPDGNKEVILNQVWIDKFNNTYWTFKNLEDIPYLRMVYANKAMRHFEFNLTRKSLVEMATQLIQSPDVATKNQLAQELINRTYFCAELETTIDVALAYFLINDEDINEYDYTIQHKKRTAWLGDGKTPGDSGALSFFLNGAYEFIKHLTPLSKEEFALYLYDQMQGKPVMQSKVISEEKKKPLVQTTKYAKSKIQRLLEERRLSSQDKTPSKQKSSDQQT